VLSAVDVQNAQCGVQRVQDAGRVYRLDNHHWTRVGGVVRWAVVFNLDCEGDYMNRRGFFGWMTAAVGWMVGVKAEPKETERLSFSWKTAEGITGLATIDVMDIRCIKPGMQIMVATGEMRFKAVVREVWKGEC
jgi:hypothetical protein